MNKNNFDQLENKQKQHNAFGCYGKQIPQLQISSKLRHLGASQAISSFNDQMELNFRATGDLRMSLVTTWACLHISPYLHLQTCLEIQKEGLLFDRFIGS